MLVQKHPKLVQHLHTHPLELDRADIVHALELLQLPDCLEILIESRGLALLLSNDLNKDRDVPCRFRGETVGNVNGSPPGHNIGTGNAAIRQVSLEPQNLRLLRLHGGRKLVS